MSLVSAVDPQHWQVARWLLACVFAAALWHKARAPREFVAVVEEYRLLPARVAAVAAASVMLLEGLVLAGLLSGAAPRPAAILAIVLLCVYFCAIGVNLLRGRRDMDCGCLGPGASVPGDRRLSGWLLLRNGLLCGAAVIVSAPVAERDLTWLDVVTIVPAVLAAALIYFTADRLIANRPVLEHLLR